MFAYYDQTIEYLRTLTNIITCVILYITHMLDIMFTSYKQATHRGRRWKTLGLQSHGQDWSKWLRLRIVQVSKTLARNGLIETVLVGDAPANYTASVLRVNYTRWPRTAGS